MALNTVLSQAESHRRKALCGDVTCSNLHIKRITFITESKINYNGKAQKQKGHLGGYGSSPGMSWWRHGPGRSRGGAGTQQRRGRHFECIAKEGSIGSTDEPHVGCERKKGSWWLWGFWPEQLEEWRPHLLSEMGKAKGEQMSGRKTECFFMSRVWNVWQIPSGGVDSEMCEELREEDYLRNINLANDFICESPKHMLNYISLLLFF